MVGAHGSFVISVDDSIINVALQGSFNEEGVLLLVKELKQQVSLFSGRPFSIIIDYLTCEGITPEGYLEVEKVHAWLGDHNLNGIAVITNSSALPLIHKTYIPTIEAINFEGFSSREDALEWLNSLRQKSA